MTQFQREVQAYEAVHRDCRNRALHAIGIPVILYAMLLGAAYLRPASTAGAIVHGGSLLVLLTTAVLFRRSRWAARWYIVLMLPLLLVASFTSQKLGLAIGLSCAAACFVGGWIIQLWGHALEGKAPLLVSSPINTLIGPVLVIRALAERLGLGRSNSEAAGLRSLR